MDILCEKSGKGEERQDKAVFLLSRFGPFSLSPYPVRVLSFAQSHKRVPSFVVVVGD
ncbi:MAG: hypothetical protein LJE88_12220 [Deltaproteobacteria bacterium]|jgi:hypothetical protein|nr:hypothetical protein [Deltaproteobacteria bacterium]